MCSKTVKVSAIQHPSCARHITTAVSPAVRSHHPPCAELSGDRRRPALGGTRRLPCLPESEKSRPVSAVEQISPFSPNCDRRASSRTRRARARTEQKAEVEVAALSGEPQRAWSRGSHRRNQRPRVHVTALSSRAFEAAAIHLDVGASLVSAYRRLGQRVPQFVWYSGSAKVSAGSPPLHALFVATILVQ